jgi:hypothetical protein
MAIDIPVGAPADWGGPFVAAAKNINALSKSMLENKIKGSEADYAPYKNYANTKLALAQAQAAAPTAIAQILSSPGAANMTAETQNALAGLAQNYLKNFDNGNMNVPAPNQMGSNGALGMIGQLISRMRGNQPNQNPVSNMPMPNSQSQLQTNQNAMTHPQPAFAPDNQPIGQGTQGGQFAQRNLNNRIQGTLGSDNANVSYEAGKAGQIAGSSTEATNLANQWTEMKKTAASQAEGAQKTVDLTSELRNAYKGLKNWEKGPILGVLPGITTPAQIFDRAKNGIANSMAEAQKGGSITGIDRNAFDSIKAGRDLGDEAFWSQVDFSDAANSRVLEKPLFLYQAQQHNLSPEQANVVWQYYINRRPIYNRNKEEINKKYLNTGEDFLNDPKLINEAFSMKARKLAIDNDAKVEKAEAAKNKVFSIPSFNNADEFRTWYNKQTPDVKNLTRKQLGEIQELPNVF